MSISSSFSAGVAGLFANSTRLATISDNIANSGTYGYKRATADFESYVLGDQRSSSVYAAGGVRANTGRDIAQNGPLISTANSTDIAISGRGFIPVVPLVSINDPINSRPMLMTTTGSFNTDENGVLTTASGLVLLGWPANADGTIPTYPRDTAGGLTPVVINANQSAGDPTTEIGLGVNLPATKTEAGVASVSDPLNLTIEYFGNLGTAESLSVSFVPQEPTSGTGMSNTWIMTISDNSQGTATVLAEVELVFSDLRGTGGTLLQDAVVNDAGPFGVTTYDSATGTLNLQVGNNVDNVITMTIGAPGDTNGLTQLSDKFAPTSITKDGSSVGNLTAVEIDEFGYVTATYDAGFTRRIYQIPLVDVPNQNGLTPLSNQTFQVSPESGSYFLWDAGDGPTGNVVGYAREGSATDVAAELTALIQTQRAYSSNATVIRTVDEMLQETTNIKR